MNKKKQDELWRKYFYYKAMAELILQELD